MTKILIVEDDENIAKMIETALSIVGYEYASCSDGLEAVRLAEEGEYDLILLDVMLPGIDGFEVMERIAGRDIPVIFLTALGEVTDKVKGLRLGAEDYLAKPFEVMELLARIEVVLRRRKKTESRLQFDAVSVELESHRAFLMGREVYLTKKEFEVLVFFLQNPNVLITRERLLGAIWGYEFEGESRTVDIHVQQVRKKMGLTKHLVTVYKLGYRLETRQ